MIEEIRSSGIDVIDHMQWGTHFCHFYETTADLLDTLVPYFKAGLDNNEYCIWVLSEPLTAAQAIGALRTAVPAIDQHLTDRDIMIVSHRDWYLRCGSFDLQSVLGSWRQQVDEALARGYAGLRVTGDIVWEDQTECNNLAEYERAIDDSISELRITALCTYALGNCGATQVFDVMETHQFALARRGGELEVVETSETKKSRAEIGRLNLELEGRVTERTRELEQRTIERQQAEKRSAAFATLARKLSGASVPLDAARIIADTADELFGWDSCSISLYDEVRDLVRPVLLIDTIDGRRIDVTSVSTEGEPTPRNRRLIEQSACLTLREEPCAFDEDSVPFGDTTRPSAAIMDVLIRHVSEIVGILSLQSYAPRSYDQDALNTLRALAEHCGEALNRMRAEQALRESEERYRDLIENSQDLFCTHDLEGRLLSANRAAEKLLDCELKELEGKSFREILAPAVRDQFDDYLERIRRNGVASGIVQVQTSKGERRIWEYLNTLRTEGVAAPIVRGMAHDITERRRAEKALREAEEKYREIFENAGEGIYQTTRQGRFLTANPAMARMFGYESPAELIRSRIDIERQHYVDPLKRQEVLRVVEENGFIKDLEYQAYRRYGRKLWITTNVRAVRGEDGTLLYYEGTAQDITDRKQAEETQRENQELFRSAFDYAAIGMALVSPDGRWLRVNHSLCELVGYSEQELLASNFQAITHPEDLAAGLTYVRQMLDNKIRSCQMEKRYFHKLGHTVWILLSVSLLRDSAGNPRYFIAQIQDITEQKQAAEALREAEQKYRELFENAKDAIYVHDLTGRYTSVNPAAEALSGYTRNEILGRHFTEFIAPEYVGPVRENLCRKLSAEGETCYEVDVIAKGGQRVPMEVNSRVIRTNGEVVGVQGTARDITERRRAQEAMRSYSRRLIEAQENERQHIARELHDEIGQILTAVRLNLQSAQRSSGTETYHPRIEDSIVVVDEALQRVRELSLQLRPALLDDLGLTAALRWYADRYAQRTGFVVEVLSDCETGGRIDRELETACYRIAQEGLTNIARHTQATRVLVELKCVRGKLLLVIKDDGAGFDVEASLKNVSAGAALGLRGMEERALALGGQFAIKSTAGQGTQVRATFPLKRKR